MRQLENRPHRMVVVIGVQAIDPLHDVPRGARAHLNGVRSPSPASAAAGGQRWRSVRRRGTHPRCTSTTMPPHPPKCAQGDCYCAGSAKQAMPVQAAALRFDSSGLAIADDLGRPACSALAMDPRLMEVRGAPCLPRSIYILSMRRICGHLC